jgi:lipoprotein-anchoring transpeptidase ErfK/SrfK
MPGVMGKTAIYLGDGIAIHGTNQPELLLNPDSEARRVSHGCIRLANDAVRTLMYMVDIGTSVLVF